jgi:preprotein translocase subunit SecA
MLPHAFYGENEYIDKKGRPFRYYGLSKRENNTMIGNFIKKIVGSQNDRELKRLSVIVDRVNELESSFRRKSDAELKETTAVLKKRLSEGETVDDILPDAFAAVRETALRTLGQRPFDVQLLGGVVLHEGKIAEMKTGEGKTLAATLPVYLNALTGRGVHVVTVNDYLARRDSEWMGVIYGFLGLTTGVIIHGLTDEERKAAYDADITYGTNNEFGFDYLRDNMKFRAEELVQRDFHYAIVDEVDSILIDEARTPLIISGPSEESTELYQRLNQLVPRLRKEADFVIDEKANTVYLNEDGVAHCEKLLKVENLYDPKYIEVIHHINQALKAHNLFKRDVDYIVKSGEVIIVDEFTGRLMPGRRYSEGLHQALEAKEGVKVARENQTLASITFQNYFRMYDKLAGMTGTADTEAAEFKKIYDLDVVVMPTNKKMIRVDHPDAVYKTEREKFIAAVEEIVELHDIGRPVLVGSISIEKSELVSSMLKKRGVKHEVLNAKHHEREAAIVAQAGQMGAVTISTNMAGRGTDIVLGEGVKELGGLHILGTERHESRRIDNQLRGRAGRQGDIGSSRFYLCLEDDLLRIFGSDRISGIMDRLGMDEGEPIEHSLVSKAIENAQKRVEGRNFDIRKHLLEYDDVMNQQRTVIYDQRRQILNGGMRNEMLSFAEDIVAELVGRWTDPDKYPEDWDLKSLSDAAFQQLSIKLKFRPEEVEDLTQEGLENTIMEMVQDSYKKKEAEFGEEDMRYLERMIMLQVLDGLWKDHLLAMDHLKEGIGMRAYAQQDPLREYKAEGYQMFAELIERIKQETLTYLLRIQPARNEDMVSAFEPKEQEMTLSHGDSGAQEPTKRKGKKVGRNDPCPCGSGKKYKKCCGR